MSLSFLRKLKFDAALQDRADPLSEGVIPKPRVFTSGARDLAPYGSSGRTAARPQQPPFKIAVSETVPKTFLYPRSASAVIAILAFVLLTALGSPAQRPQLKRPEEQAPEDKPPAPKKPKVKGPRALGLLQFTPNGKATLIPIAILVEGHYYDASAYKADPVPMALEGGIVYEAEQAGASQGLFTINAAMHSKNPNASPWIGTGSYVQNGTEVAKTAHKAESVPRGLDSSDNDAPPRLTRGSDSKSAPANTSSTPASGTSPSSGTSSSSASSPSASSSGGSPDKAGAASATATQPASAAPADSKSAASSSGGSSSAGNSPAGSTPAPDAPKPAPTAASAKPADTSANAQTSPQQSDNYYRPTLRRGKPEESAPPQEEAEDKTEAKPANAASPASTPGSATPQPVRLVPAISDAGGPDPRAYRFFWKEGEEDERRKQMLDLAGNELRAYVNALARNLISAKPASPPSAKTGTTHKPAAKPKPAEAVFENVQFHAFDVWVNNQPVMILTAEGHLNPPPTLPTGPVPESYSITLVARTDIYGELRKLYSGVTDKFHLDVTPRLELIDAVDVDGDGRGELLFRETTDAGNGYIIYRATPDKLMKLFNSLES